MPGAGDPFPRALRQHGLWAIESGGKAATVSVMLSTPRLLSASASTPCRCKI
jgi:hypothetical protein